MLVQRFIIPRYGWDVTVYYHMTCYYTNEILAKLKTLGCNSSTLHDAYLNMKSCKLNTGLTYSNLNDRQSVIVISKTSEPAEFLNSLFHEVHHLVSHIVEADELDVSSEEPAYLSGYIGQLIYPKARQFLCKCHRLQ